MAPIPPKPPPRCVCGRTGLERLFSEHQLKPEFIADKGLQSYDLRILKPPRKMEP